MVFGRHVNWNRVMWKKEARPISSPVVNRWHAVSVVGKGDCCQAAWSLAERRFLSREAPRLPLEQCAKPADCRCAYQHHPDRRGEPRRRQEVGGLWLEQYKGDERRRARGRRSTDAEAVHDWRG
jgi:hypothetical protein